MKHVIWHASIWKERQSRVPQLKLWMKSATPNPLPLLPESITNTIPRKKKIQRTWKWMELRKKCRLSFCPGPETTAAAVGPSYEISWAIGSSNIILNYSRDFEKELERRVRCNRMEFLFAIGPQRSTKRKFSSFHASFFFRTGNAAADSRLVHFFQQCGCGSGFKAHAFFSRTTDAICLRSKFKFLILNICLQ